MVKLVKYLPEFGLQPLVLCATPDERMPLDWEAYEEIRQWNVPIYRTPSFDPYQLWNLKSRLTRRLSGIRSAFDLEKAPPETEVKAAKAGSSGRAGFSYLQQMLALPDDRAGWLPHAIPAAERIVRSQAVRYVLTSSYPHSAHIVGRHLKKRYKIKWLADFRDGWTQNPYFGRHATPFHRSLNERLEKSVLQQADQVTTVSEPIAGHLRSLTSPDKVHVLPNGFDPDDFEDIEPLDFDKFTIGYTGTLFMQRSPEVFFTALRGLLDSYPGLAENIQAVFRSNFKAEHEEIITALNLQQVVVNLGMGTYRESLQLQKSSDVLLVLEGAAQNSEIMLTQKIFEYLAAGKPVVAVTPPGALADLVRRTGCGIVIPPDNAFRLKEVLFDLFLGRLTFSPRQEIIETFHRRHQARRFAEILRQSSPPLGT